MTLLPTMAGSLLLTFPREPKRSCLGDQDFDIEEQESYVPRSICKDARAYQILCVPVDFVISENVNLEVPHLCPP